MASVADIAQRFMRTHGHLVAKDDTTCYGYDARVHRWHSSEVRRLLCNEFRAEVVPGLVAALDKRLASPRSLKAIEAEIARLAPTQEFDPVRTELGFTNGILDLLTRTLRPRSHLDFLLGRDTGRPYVDPDYTNPVHLQAQDQLAAWFEAMHPPDSPEMTQLLTAMAACLDGHCYAHSLCRIAKKHHQVGAHVARVLGSAVNLSPIAEFESLPRFYAKHPDTTGWLCLPSPAAATHALETDLCPDIFLDLLAGVYLEYGDPIELAPTAVPRLPTVKKRKADAAKIT
jgi:hypothetical protein